MENCGGDLGCITLCGPIFKDQTLQETDSCSSGMEKRLSVLKIHARE